MAITSAIVDMEIMDNATWQDAFVFGTPGDLSWSFANQHFRMDLKSHRRDTTPLLTMTDANGMIVVSDPIQRILYFNVSEATIQASFPVIPGTYLYDLIMYDGSTPAIRVPLLTGRVKVIHGITGG